MIDRKKQVLKLLSEGLNTYSKVMLGKAYDAGFEHGKSEGIEDAYRAGFRAANRYGCRAFIACTCKALRQVFGYGRIRMQRVCDKINENLITEIDINETLDWCEKTVGLKLVDDLLTPDEEE